MAKISIPPSPNLIETLASSGYTLETAAGDIVDNSIDAGANTILIEFDYDSQIIRFIDNGFGMNEDELRKAAIPANKSKFERRDDDVLGRFSLGLKASSASICNKLIIISLKNLKMHKLTMDFKHIVESNNWEAELEPTTKDPLLKNSGTIIEWHNLKAAETYKSDKTFYYQDIKKIEKYLKITYSEILKKGLIIKLNGTEVSAYDPFMSENTKTKVVDQREIDLNGETISVKTYILPNLDSLNDSDKSKILSDGIIESQGFYIYRNKRLIIQGKWMGLSNLKTDNKSQYARIKVDINNKLDEEFQINFMKNFAIIPSAIKDDFISIAKKARTESLNNLNYIKRKKQIGRKRTDDFVYIWLVENTKDGQKLAINLDHPIIKEFTNEFGLKRIKKLVNVFSKTIPVSQIRQGGFSINEQLSDSEFKEIFDKIFEKYKKQGLNNQQIYSALSNIEPFSNNKEKLYELIGEISDGQ